jgi:hypothetical protein
VLLTLLSMRMVVPVGMRFVFRRHRATPPMPIPGDGDAVVEEPE